MICNILDNTTELYMIKYTIGEIFSSGGATLYKNPSDQTVILVYLLADCRPIPIFENLNRIFLPNLIDLILQWLHQRHTNHFHRKNMHSFFCNSTIFFTWNWLFIFYVKSILFFSWNQFYVFYLATFKGENRSHLPVFKS